MIKCQAVDALGATVNPVAVPPAVEVLVRVLKEPPVAAEASETEKELGLDVRKTAARALGHFKQHQASEALLVVLRTEGDIALRGRATMSLREITGKDLPPDAQAWAEALHSAPNAPPTGVAEQGGTNGNVLPAGGWRK
jgi:hypothetical protein